MARWRSVRALGLALHAAAEGVVLSLFWGILASCGLALPPLPAICWVAATVTAFLLYPRLQPTRSRVRRAATVGLRGFAPAVRWFAVAVPFFLLSVLLLALIQERITTEPGPVRLSYRFAQRQLGWAVLPLLVIAAAPLFEEVFLRGFVQARIARRVGPLVGVFGAAAVFAVAHLSRAWLLYYLAVGLAFGYARFATRSIWAAVALHAAMNGLAVGLAALAIAPGLFGQWSHRVWLTGSLLFASASMTVFAIHRAGVSVRLQRGQRSRHTGAPPALMLAPSARWPSPIDERIGRAVGNDDAVGERHG